MVASALCVRKSSGDEHTETINEVAVVYPAYEVDQKISLTLENAELQTPDGQYSTMYNVMHSLINICGLSYWDSNDYGFSSMNYYLNGTAQASGITQKMHGSVTFRTGNNEIVSYFIDDFVPYEVIPGATIYYSGVYINTFIKALQIYRDNGWVFLSGNFIITNRKVEA